MKCKPFRLDPAVCLQTSLKHKIWWLQFGKAINATYYQIQDPWRYTHSHTSLWASGPVLGFGDFLTQRHRVQLTSSFAGLFGVSEQHEPSVQDSSRNLKRWPLPDNKNSHWTQHKQHTLPVHLDGARCIFHALLLRQVFNWIYTVKSVTLFRRQRQKPERAQNLSLKKRKISLHKNTDASAMLWRSSKNHQQEEYVKNYSTGTNLQRQWWCVKYSKYYIILNECWKHRLSFRTQIWLLRYELDPSTWIQFLYWNLTHSTCGTDFHLECLKLRKATKWACNLEWKSFVGMGECLGEGKNK